TVRFGNDHVAAILGFDDIQWGNILITRVYFVEGLGHNLFSVGQFCDSNLEVAFRRNDCFVKNLEGVDLVYNHRTKKIIETMNVSFDELSVIAFEQRSSKRGLNNMTSGHISSGLDLTYAPSTITSQQPSEEPQVHQSSTTSTKIADTAPIPTNSSSLATNIPITSQDVNELNPNAMVDGNTFANSSTSAAASSSQQNVDPSNMHTFYQPYPHEFQWTKDHPLEQVIGEPSRPVLIRNQLRYDGDTCMYALTFKRMDVWVLVPALDNISPLTLKWIFKNKHDEEQTVIRNKSLIVVRGYRQEEGIDFEESFAPTLSRRHLSGTGLQKIKRLQAQLGDLKGKSKDTSYVSDTRNSLSQKLENENVELEFQVLNYARENAHLKATYKNLFDSISVSHKNAKLRMQLFKKVSDQKDNTHDSSKNTKFAKQPIVENLSKIGKANALSNPVTSNSVSSPQVSKGVNNDKVIAPGMFRINPSKTSREEKQVPNTVSASTRTKPITISQPHIITKKEVNSDSNGLSSTGIDNTKTRRPQPRSNIKNDRVPSTSKSSQSQNKEAEVEEYHKNLLLSKNNKHISSACNNIKIDSQDVISKVVCAMCKKCLISVNHDKCLSKHVNGKNSCGKHQKAKVSVKEIQKKYQPKVAKPKKVGIRKSLATPKPRKPRFILRWSPTGKLFNQEGKLVDSSESKSKSNGNLKLLINFVWKFMGTVRFGNDHVAAILGFGDLQWGNILITRIYFVEGLGHNLFSIGQFCDLDLEVAFRRDACFRLHLLHMDLCRPMRIASINGKRYVLVIVDDYSRYTWVHFLRSKDEAPEVIIKFLKRIMVLLQSPVIIIRTDNGTEFKNQVLKEYFDTVGISHQMSSVQTPQQNGVVERRNRTVYNHGTKKIMETMNVSFDELSAMAFEQRILFEAMYDDYFGGQPSATVRTVSPAQEPQVLQSSMASTTIADIAPIPTNSSSHATNILISLQDVDEQNPNAMVDDNTFVNPFANPSTSAIAASSS
nr:integrase, catalytic region, zinc finger, CCHC-type, peptidase aspartic, catalytic [Tanacetum cinerariifolium]